MERVQQEILGTTEKGFRIAYYLAKNNCPNTDHHALIDLQRVNGLKMGRVLHSNVTCTDIVHSILKEVKQALMAKL